jgi:pSer/pThr/pTyr-binding forkhead associated (FHA) protein
VVLVGVAPGSEFDLDQPKLTVGRGPGVDLAFDDTALSREHGAFEFSDAGFRIRDLGSTNGIQLNDEAVRSATLEHGDRVKMGTHVFQFILEDVTPEPNTYVLTDD